MNIWENMLIEFQDDEGLNLEVLRVLWINSSGTEIVTIDINNPKAFPVWQQTRELEEALTEQKAKHLEADPFAYLYRPENLISEKHRQLRDFAWTLIAPMIEKGTDIFFHRERGRLVQEIIDRTGSTKPTIYKYLRMYWQGGQKHNALLPRYDNCGGKGKKRQITRKLGRTSQQTKLKGKPEGINVDDQIRLIIIQSAKKFHEKQGLTLKDSHQRMLETVFSLKIQDREGVTIPLLWAENQCPTLRQFCYWYYKQKDLEKSLITREGQRRYNLRYREITGTCSDLASFPGALWQIDSTIADIYLVSSLDRNRIIGRPVLYLVVDVFSRLIVGFNVSLEGPSWLGASLALLNAATDKVKFSQEFGISIDPHEWPCQHLCKRLQTDRGSEYISHSAREALKTLNIELSLTPAYRPDWKAVVERLFRTINDEVIHWQPGAVYKPRERGDKDYRLEAIYTLKEFSQILIRMIVEYNNYHYLKDYPLTKEMISDHVHPCPRELWDWGTRNCGRPRTESGEIVRLNLLHRGEATVTRQGICFRHPMVNLSNRLRYTCSLAITEQWFIKARVNGSWKIPVAYDPRYSHKIYLIIENGKKTEICQLLPASKTFYDCDLLEILDYFASQSLTQQSTQKEQRQAKATLNAYLEQYQTSAQEKTEKARQSDSKRSRIKGIRSARKQEREHERSFHIENNQPEDLTTQTAPVIPLPTLINSIDEDDEEYIAPRRPFDKLRNFQNKKLNDE